MVLTHGKLLVLTLAVTLSVNPLLDALLAGHVQIDPLLTVNRAVRHQLIAGVDEVTLIVLLGREVVLAHVVKRPRTCLVRGGRHPWKLTTSSRNVAWVAD